jgi:hypothetical protein
MLKVAPATDMRLHLNINLPRPTLLKAYRIAKWIAIVLIAVSMAEFLAADVAMSVAGDLMVYVEIIVAGWLFWLTARLWPGAAVAFGNLVWGGSSTRSPESRPEVREAESETESQTADRIS